MDIIEKKNKLIAGIEAGNDPDKGLIIDMVESYLNSFAKYVKAVNEQENAITVARFRERDPKRIIERIEKLNGERTRLHEDCISGVNFLNRLCKEAKLSFEFFTGDLENRYEIADFVFEVVSKTFKNRKL